MAVTNKPGVWYHIYIDYCVLCGRTIEERERREGPKPEDESKRYEYHEGSCGDHFC